MDCGIFKPSWDKAGTHSLDLRWTQVEGPVKENTLPQVVWNVADAELSTPSAACCKGHSSNTVDPPIGLHGEAQTELTARREGALFALVRLAARIFASHEVRFGTAIIKFGLELMEDPFARRRSFKPTLQAFYRLDAAAARSTTLDGEISAFQSERGALSNKIALRDSELTVASAVFNKSEAGLVDLVDTLQRVTSVAQKKMAEKNALL